MRGISDIPATAPQFPNIGTGQQYELLDWLEHITFPVEKKFADEDFARTLYKEVVRRVLALGVCIPVLPFPKAGPDHICATHVDNNMLLLWDTAPGSDEDTCGRMP